MTFRGCSPTAPAASSTATLALSAPPAGASEPAGRVRFSRYCFDGAALDTNCPTMDEGGRRLSTSLGQDTSRRGSRHVHHLSNLFVGKTFQIRQTHRLKFVVSQGNLFQAAHGHPGGLEMDHFGVVSNKAWFERSGQFEPPV
jgi:hypothetical protein